MRVGELIELLSNYDEDMQIVFRPQRSDYVELFSNDVEEMEVRRFYGEPRDYLVIYSDGQVGMV